MKTDWNKQRKALIDGIKNGTFRVTERRVKEILGEMKKAEEKEKLE